MAPAALTPLSLSALALLTEAPMHPYEMYQLLIKRFKNEIVKVRPGSLYHAVDRLARDGLAAVVGNGPRRQPTRAYDLRDHSDAGRAALEARVSRTARDAG